MNIIYTLRSNIIIYPSVQHRKMPRPHDEINGQCDFCGIVHDDISDVKQCDNCDRKVCYYDCRVEEDTYRRCDKCYKFFCNKCIEKMYRYNDHICINCYHPNCKDCGHTKNINEVIICHLCNDYSCCGKNISTCDGIKFTCLRCLKRFNLCDVCYDYDVSMYKCLKCNCDICDACTFESDDKSLYCIHCMNG